jgi:hypothetical protein
MSQKMGVADVQGGASAQPTTLPKLKPSMAGERVAVIGSVVDDVVPINPGAYAAVVVVGDGRGRYWL